MTPVIVPDNDSNHRGTVYDNEEQGELVTACDRSGQSPAAKELFAIAIIRAHTATFECGLAAEGPVTSDSCRAFCAAANRRRCATALNRLRDTDGCGLVLSAVPREEIGGRERGPVLRIKLSLTSPNMVRHA
jgi:hypothetical protein